MITRSLILCFALAVLAGAFVSPAAAAPVPKDANKRPVAFIHGSDVKSATDYKDLLDGAGFRVELIAIGDVAKTDFGKFVLIVIGADHGRTPWGAAGKAVDQSGLPVLALGTGGATLLDELKLGIGLPNVWHGQNTGVLPVDASESPLWKGLQFPADKPVALYTKTAHVGVHLPKPVAGVVLLGREEKDATHYPLVRQGRYVLWGFEAGPDGMTAEGRKLFVATCKYTAALVPPREKKE